VLYGESIPYEYGLYAEYANNMVFADNMVVGNYYNAYVYESDNIVINNNSFLNGLDDGVYIEYCDDVWFEGNVVSWNDGDGVYLYDCYYVVIGNNTISNNMDEGLDISSCWMVTLYNGEFSGNEDEGLDTDSDNGLVWYIDAGAKVARNDVEFYGAIKVLAGGSMIIEDVHEFYVYDDDNIIVDQGGMLSASNSNFYGDGNIEVYGTFWANVCLFDGFDIYLGPTSEAEIRGGAIMFYSYAGVHVDGSTPVIADNLIFSPYAMYGILVEGEGAAPSIVSNIIALNNQGVYAQGTDMGGVYDNLFLLNVQSGILAEDATGKIHDNVFLANKIEILLRNSDVSVEDNEIGYTNLFQTIANYAPLLSHLGLIMNLSSDSPTAMLGSVLGISDFDPYDLATWLKGHNGIWAEDSKVQTSGNVYGLLNYALYSVRSEIHFADDVRTIKLTVPHVIEGEMFNYTLDVFVLNGIFASGSKVWIDGSTIEVLDDAVMLENSEAWVEGATLMAGDFDYFLYNGAEVYNIATTYGKAKVMDSHSLNEATWLTLHAVDDGDPAANVSVVIKNAKGDIVYQGVTDAEGKIRVLLTQYSITSEGKDDGFNPYTINAAFESGDESMELTLNESYMDVTIEGQEESDMGAILAVIGVLVIILLIVAAVVVMRRRK
jgi:parallel beta-helix repeat protein